MTLENPPITQVSGEPLPVIMTQIYSLVNDIEKIHCDLRANVQRVRQQAFAEKFDTLIYEVDSFNEAMKKLLLAVIKGDGVIAARHKFTKAFCTLREASAEVSA